MLKIFKKRKKGVPLNSIGVDSLKEVGDRLKYLERDLMKHGMGVAADSLNVEPTGNKYVEINLRVIIFKHPLRELKGK